jgi:glucosamine-6-phosphate deaminase
MNVEVHESEESLAEAAAKLVASITRDAIAERGEACLVAATGASQLRFLDALAREAGVDWSKVTFFHLDEYVGLSADHPASFRKYLRERVADRLHPGAFHYVDGEAPDVGSECRRLGDEISRRVVDVALVGIGENGHIAFNDPPADFDTREPYIVVELDEACRAQQVGEGWFRSPDEVPRHAISMSAWQILRARHVVAVVPEQRKARAVRDCLEEEISPLRPASVLRRHPSAVLFLEPASASLLRDYPERDEWSLDGR